MVLSLASLNPFYKRLISSPAARISPSVFLMRL
jgi:hypothetical protein